MGLSTDPWHLLLFIWPEMEMKEGRSLVSHFLDTTPLKTMTLMIWPQKGQLTSWKYPVGIKKLKSSFQPTAPWSQSGRADWAIACFPCFRGSSYILPLSKMAEDFLRGWTAMFQQSWGFWKPRGQTISFLFHQSSQGENRNWTTTMCLLYLTSQLLCGVS